MGRLRDYGAEVEQSGVTFTLGDLRVDISYGFSEGGDWLRFLVIRACAVSATVEERLADPRCDCNSGNLPKIRHPDGTMRRVGTDGHAYLFVGGELRTLRVNMNEHTDTGDLVRAGSLEAMWEYLQRYRVAGS